MSELSDFRTKLCAILPKDDRPFVCQGSPYNYKIFVVGENPATKMANGFWPYWDDCKGFNKDAWCEAYKKERHSQGKKDYVSRTRGNLNKLADSVGTDEILETNIYSKPTSGSNKLRAKDKVTYVFEFLLEEIKPNLIVTHGKPAADLFGREFQTFGDFAIKPDFFRDNRYGFVSLRHARSWKHSAIPELADEIRGYLGL